MIPEKLLPISFVSKDNNGDLNGGCLDFNLWEELMSGIYENKKNPVVFWCLEPSRKVIWSRETKLFGVGKQIAIFN